MPYKLKTTPDGVAQLKDGNPVYVDETGTEIAFDVNRMRDKIQELSSEAKENRLKGKQASDDLGVFRKKYEGIDDPEAAKAAIAAMANMDEKQQVAVDSLKKSMQDAWDAKELARTQADKERDEKEKKLTEDIAKSREKISRMMIGELFTQSPVVRNTILPPQLAAQVFGGQFRIEDINGVPTAVGYQDGTRIASEHNPGDLASFEEALERIISKYPERDRIMKAASGGSGASGGVGSGAGGEKRMTNQQWLTALSSAKRTERQQLHKDKAAGRIVLV